MLTDEKIDELASINWTPSGDKLDHRAFARSIESALTPERAVAWILTLRGSGPLHLTAADGWTVEPVRFGSPIDPLAP